MILIGPAAADTSEASIQVENRDIPFENNRPRMENREPYFPFKGRIGSPILLRAIPTHRGRTPILRFWDVFRVFSQDFGFGVCWKAENAFGHNALTRRIDPHAAEILITSENKFFASIFLHFSRPFHKPARPNTNFEFLVSRQIQVQNDPGPLQIEAQSLII